MRLSDITRSLPQRIEGQFRRHWGFALGLWNLHFRNEINLGISLSVQKNVPSVGPSESCVEDAAMAAAALVQKLQHGSYLHQGKRRKINGDFTKLLFAEHLTDLQRRLLADYRFRCRAIPGTQEIRTKIGRIGVWASVVYGNGIFMTVSPGERHNYLAIRLSRYRVFDPYMDETTDNGAAQKPWCGVAAPSLEPKTDDIFEMNIPGYDLRRVMMAQDPLGAANAFFVQLRTVLATALGVRMCPHCPHCSSSRNPCQDAFGSNAEFMGGLAGRADAMFGAVECQKSNGSLHYHFFLFVQRLHQYATVLEIAELLEQALANADDLKNFLAAICYTTYGDLDAHKKDWLTINFENERQAQNNKNVPDTHIGKETNS